MTTDKVIILARKHLANDSARMALRDAINLDAAGDLVYARKRAIDSLRYSLGVFSPIFKKAIGE